MSILNNGTILTTSEVNTATYKNIVNSRYWLGASETFGPSYDGDFLEVINYSASNTATDKRRIESYLAIKYGITLGVNGTSLDYYNSASTNAATAIYTAGAGFNYNIAGIGRDDASQLNQKQSKTVNTNDDITIGLTDIAATNTANTNTGTNFTTHYPLHILSFYNILVVKTFWSCHTSLIHGKTTTLIAFHHLTVEIKTLCPRCRWH